MARRRESLFWGSHSDSFGGDVLLGLPKQSSLFGNEEWHNQHK